MKVILYIFAFIILAISPFFGEITLNLRDVLDPTNSANMVFWDLRVSRVLLAFFVGGILSLGGLIFQIIFKNELITPYTLGIASGTTLFTAVAIVFFPMLNITISSIFGSMVTILILKFS